MSRLLVTIQHLLTLSTHPLSLTLLPICFSVGCGLAATKCPTREPYRFGNYLVALVVLTEKPSLSTPQLVGLFRCCLFAGFIMSIVCLLAGIVSSRPSAFVAGAGVEPAAHPRLFRESPNALRWVKHSPNSICRFAPLFRLFLPFFLYLAVTPRVNHIIPFSTIL